MKDFGDYSSPFIISKTEASRINPLPIKVLKLGISPKTKEA